jgi:hypothetical protein
MVEINFANGRKAVADAIAYVAKKNPAEKQAKATAVTAEAVAA